MKPITILFLVQAAGFLALAVMFAVMARRQQKREKADRLAIQDYWRGEASLRPVEFTPLDVVLMDDDSDLRQSHAPAAVHSKWEVN